MWRTIICLLLVPSAAHATKFAEPKRHDVFSPNRVYVLDVDPKTNRHTVFAAKDRDKPLWSFNKRIWHEPLFLSNHGRVVVCFHWKFVWEKQLAEEECIEFLNKDEPFRTYSFTELCPDPGRTWLVPGGGPIGLGCRTWYTQLDQDEDSIHVETTDLHGYTFSIADGELAETRLLLINALYKPQLYVAFVVALAVAVVLVVRRLRKRRSRKSHHQAKTEWSGELREFSGPAIPPDDPALEPHIRRGQPGEC